MNPVLILPPIPTLNALPLLLNALNPLEPIPHVLFLDFLLNLKKVNFEGKSAKLRLGSYCRVRVYRFGLVKPVNHHLVLLRVPFLLFRLFWVEHDMTVDPDFFTQA